MSGMNPLKAKFSELLRYQLKVSRIPQRQIAEVLGISPSAVCQIMRGYTMPKLQHFNMLCELMSIPRETAAELRHLRTQIRAGDTSDPSPFNTLLRSFREQRGISVLQLSNLTGLSQNEVKLLEECPESVPTASECERLSEVLNCNASDLMRAAGLPDPNSPVVSAEKYPVNAIVAPTAEVAEGQAIYRGSTELPENKEHWHPVLPIRMLPKDEGLNSFDYAFRRAVDFKYDPKMPYNCVVVRGATRDLGMRDKGTFELTVVRGGARSHNLALAPREDEWRIGLLLPYRRINSFDGTVESAPPDRMIWRILQMAISLDL